MNELKLNQELNTSSLQIMNELYSVRISLKEIWCEYKVGCILFSPY
jgi:hypothetical protein